MNYNNIPDIVNFSRLYFYLEGRPFCQVSGHHLHQAQLRGYTTLALGKLGIKILKNFGMQLFNDI